MRFRHTPKGSCLALAVQAEVAEHRLFSPCCSARPDSSNCVVLMQSLPSQAQLLKSLCCSGYVTSYCTGRWSASKLACAALEAPVRAGPAKHRVISPCRVADAILLLPPSLALPVPMPTHLSPAAGYVILQRRGGLSARAGFLVEQCRTGAQERECEERPMS